MTLKKPFLTCHGVRGSWPKSGPEFSWGHTACVSYTGIDGIFVFDAGSGLCDFSKKLYEVSPHTKPTIHLFLSHYHMDHIMGLPFFEGFFTKTAHVNLYAPLLENHDPHTVLKELIRPPYYPFTYDMIKDGMTLIPFHVGDTLNVLDHTIHTILLNHPGGSCGYRVQKKDELDFCYITDVGTEDLNDVYPKGLGEFVAHTQLLIQDAYFTLKDFQKFHFFGHGTYEGVAKFATQYGVKRLGLYHHNPHYTESMLVELEKQAQRHHAHAFLLKEGQTIPL